MPDVGIERPRFCSQCGQPVTVADAVFCKECGAPLAVTAWFSHDISWRPSIALLLSVVPGLGHFYKGQVGRGIAWFVVVIVMYLSPNAWAFGFVLHVICAFNAALSGAIREEAFRHSPRRRDRLSATAGPRP
jgi:TM2 domain-containing membrane protein YozV